MHIIIALLGAAAAAIFFLVRMKHAADEGREMVEDVAGAVRRGRWSRKADARLIDNLTDPRDAAAILMVQIASYDGEVTAAQKSRIESLMIERFQCAPDHATGFYSFGRMVIGQLNDAANSLAKVLRPVKAELTLTEMRDLVAMLETVAEVEGTPNDRQRDLIAAVRRALSLSELA